MRHGEAAPGDDDAQRPLTDAGRRAVSAVARSAGRAGVKIDAIRHSGLVRASESATILAGQFGITAEAAPGLLPDDEVRPVIDWLAGHDDSGALALVGHVPFLNRLAAALTGASEQLPPARFAPASMMKLVPRASGDSLVVEWLITSDLAGEE